jgi:2-polyprenyl-3-methyl-5-hydroxy-6-metoxy-1,4-benzoquinol methylase
MIQAPISPQYEQVENLSSNHLTLQTYEQSVQEYIDGTPAEVSGATKEWIDWTLERLSSQATIIEIGSAFGRDANFIESQGFTVERTDATEAFVVFLQNQGHPVKQFNILTDAFHASYDLVFANAVFLHFPPSELETILKKVHATLKPDGLLAFSVKKGEGEEWSTAKVGKPRYFCYWTEDKMRYLLEKTHFQVVYFAEDERWLYFTVETK